MAFPCGEPQAGTYVTRPNGALAAGHDGIIPDWGAQARAVSGGGEPHRCLSRREPRLTVTKARLIVVTRPPTLALAQRRGHLHAMYYVGQHFDFILGLDDIDAPSRAWRSSQAAVPKIAYSP